MVVGSTDSDATGRWLAASLARRRRIIAPRVTEQQRLASALPSVRPRVQAHIVWLAQERADLRSARAA